MLNEQSQLIIYLVQYINKYNETINLGTISYQPKQYQSLLTITPNLQRILQLQPHLKSSTLIHLINYSYQNFHKNVHIKTGPNDNMGTFDWVDTQFENHPHANLKLVKLIDDDLKTSDIPSRILKVNQQQL